MFEAPPFDGSLPGGSDGVGAYNRYLFANRSSHKNVNPGSAALGGQVTEVRVYDGSPLPAQSRAKRDLCVARPPSIGVLLAPLCALLLAASPWRPHRSSPPAPPGPLECTPGPTFDLIAKDGRIQLPDGASPYMWGYALDDPDDTFQIPGPVLCVTAGRRGHDQPDQRAFRPDLPGLPRAVRCLGSGRHARAPGAGGRGRRRDRELLVHGEPPGTYIYESGTEPHKQVQMGLYGAIIVRPSMGDPTSPTTTPSTEFDPDARVPDPAPRHRPGPPPGRRARAPLRHHHEARPLLDDQRTLVPGHDRGQLVPWLPHQPYGVARLG